MQNMSMITTNYMIRSLLLLALSVVCTTHAVHANSGGVSRRAVLTSNGCGPSGCHGGSASTSTTVRVVGLADAADLRVVAGQSIDITIAVGNALAVATGVNIAVKTELNATMNSGTLTTKPGSGLTRLNSELTHSTPKSFADGVAEFTFSWTAPVQADTVFLHAIANAVNRNGSPDQGDKWNWMQPVRIIIEPASSVAESSPDVHTLDLRPVPSHGDVAITIPESARGEEYAMLVIDPAGVIVHRSTVHAGGAVVVAWDGRMANGVHAPNGSYVVVLQNERRVFRGRAVIVR